MYQVAICDPIHTKGIELLEAQKDIILHDYSACPKTELLEKLIPMDALITRSMTPITSDFLSPLTNLKSIVRAGVGVDNIDLESCSQKGIVVMNIPTANTIAAVELTMAHIINAVRTFPGANEQIKHQRLWKREDWYGTELKGKKLGIIGFGNIGSRVGIRAKAFEMEVLAYDPYIPSSKATDLGAIYTKNFEDILQCDIITIHTPKNEETINIIGTKEIERMKKGVILINCARGGLYNEDALYEALETKKVRWLGIDVFSKEPGIHNKLLDLPNVYATPHIGANTLESQEEISKQAAQGVMESLRGSSHPHALNLPMQVFEPSMKAYLNLAQKLGYFASQIHKGVCHKIEFNLCGEISKHEDALVAFMLVGVLKPIVGDKINYINAPFVAKERGIEIQVTLKESASPYKNMLSLTLNATNGTMSVSGTVFEEDILKLTNINGFDIDIEPKGKMLLFRNTDIPGVIGNVGNAFARHSINIADFRLGRNAQKEALALIIVDEEVSLEVLEELKNIPACLSVHHVII
ncbi:phosphoglycerate dehydrogenase [Helicobacter cetorum]|uniref:D-3-phosphoglycerate dehydrogenase n=1 Tax=Helicobacter cetorum (strain ATCC BAA-429 / MIT 00-7128) TaxID=182217 RepID=I0EPG9_HELC0|nr:phosphoglycerate dehydrogenase [Helicobacter cetorum]AFI04838.1 D-3-phosphoglycerate dehydrogenase [Helicobacter cetorum MIT 00-7128]